MGPTGNRASREWAQPGTSPCFGRAAPSSHEPRNRKLGTAPFVTPRRERLRFQETWRVCHSRAARVPLLGSRACATAWQPRVCHCLGAPACRRRRTSSAVWVLYPNSSARVTPESTHVRAYHSTCASARVPLGSRSLCRGDVRRKRPRPRVCPRLAAAASPSHHQPIAIPRRRTSSATKRPLLRPLPPTTPPLR